LGIGRFQDFPFRQGQVKKAARFFVVKIEHSRTGGDEQKIGVFADGPNLVVGNGKGILRAVGKYLEVTPVKTVQPAFGACPHKAFPVLEYAGHKTLRQPFFNADSLHARRLGAQARHKKRDAK